MDVKVTLPKPDFCDCFGKFPLQTDWFSSTFVEAEKLLHVYS